MNLIREKLVNLQMERSDIEIELNKIKLEQDYLLDKYSIQDQEIEFGDFVTIETISAYLTNTILPAKNVLSFTEIETEHKKQLLIKELELESSEKKRLVDFVQFKYNGPHSDALQERFSVGLSFQLSTSGNRKLKMQELQIEKEELIRKSERDIQEKQEDLYKLEYKLLGDIQAFSFFQKTMQEERAQLQNLSSKISQKEGSSPLLLLDIEERHLSMKVKSLNKKKDLLRDYLRYVHQTERMCQSDFVNYLNP